MAGKIRIAAIAANMTCPFTKPFITLCISVVTLSKANLYLSGVMDLKNLIHTGPSISIMKVRTKIVNIEKRLELIRLTALNAEPPPLFIFADN